jgi:hypothetical protein
MKEFLPETLKVGPDGSLFISEDQRSRWDLAQGLLQ